MARLAVISDLHASLAALDAVLADARARGADRVVCLGDIVDLGPEPGEVVRRLRDEGVPCVRGNHDPLDEHPGLPKLAAVEDWTRAKLTADEHAWLAELPTERVEDLDGLTVLCVHGSPRSCTDGVQAETPEATLRAWWGDRVFDVMVCGHTHVPLLRRLGDRLVVNVGSVGQPFYEVFSGAPPRVLRWSEYALLEHRNGAVSVEHRRLPLDLDALTRALNSSGFPDAAGWGHHWR